MHTHTTAVMYSNVYSLVLYEIVIHEQNELLLSGIARLIQPCSTWATYTRLEIHTYACMYCMYVCMYVCVYVCTYACVYVLFVLYVCMYPDW